MNADMAARKTRHGYVAVATTRPRVPCASPIVNDRLAIEGPWATTCFFPAYTRARNAWGAHAEAITKEILGELMPDMRVAEPELGAEIELRRRVELAVAALLNSAGVPTRYPRKPVTPRPVTMPAGPAWYRALLTGWLR